MQRRRRGDLARLVAGLLAAAGVLALTSCGGGSSTANTTTTASTSSAESTPSTKETSLALAADPNGRLAYDKKTLDAPAGKVTIVLTNDSSISHDVAIKGNGVDEASDLVDNGDTAQVSAQLAPGTYTFYCTVPGHEAAGMKGTLTVR